MVYSIGCQLRHFPFLSRQHCAMMIAARCVALERSATAMTLEILYVSNNIGSVSRAICIFSFLHAASTLAERVCPLPFIDLTVGEILGHPDRHACLIHRSQA